MSILREKDNQKRTGKLQHKTPLSQVLSFISNIKRLIFPIKREIILDEVKDPMTIPNTISKNHHKYLNKQKQQKNQSQQIQKNRKNTNHILLTLFNKTRNCYKKGSKNTNYLKINNPLCANYWVTDKTHFK